MGASPSEVSAVVAGLLAKKARDSATAKQILEEIRGNEHKQK